MIAHALASLLFLSAQEKGPEALRELLKEPEKIAFYSDCAPLLKLLREGDVKGFNEARAAFKDKYLDFGDYLGAGGRSGRDADFFDLDLRGADFSRVLFGRTRFNGSRLDGCDFSRSFLSPVLFYDPPSLSDFARLAGKPSPFGPKTTTVAGINLSDLILEKQGLWRTLAYVDLSKVELKGPAAESVAARSFPREYGEIVRGLTEGKSVVDVVTPRRGSPLDVEAHGVPVPNPFETMPPEQEKTWADAGLDPAALRSLKAVRINGSFPGISWVNRNPKVLFVLGEGFFTQGEIVSRGPVLFTGRAHVMADLYSDSWVGCFDEAFPRSLIHAKPILLGSGGHAESLLSPVVRASLGGDWKRNLLRQRSALDALRRLHPDRTPTLTPSLGAATSFKELLGEKHPNPFQGMPEFEALPVLLLSKDKLTKLEREERVLYHGDPKQVVAIPLVFGLRIDALYSEGPVLLFDEEKTWSAPPVVSRSLVRSTGTNTSVREQIEFDPPLPAPAAGADLPGTSKPVPAAIARGNRLGFEMGGEGGISFFIVTRGEEAILFALGRGPMGFRQEPGFAVTLGDHRLTDESPPGVYVGDAEKGWTQVPDESAAAVAKKYRELKKQGAAPLEGLLKSKPAIRKALDAGK